MFEETLIFQNVNSRSRVMLAYHSYHGGGILVKKKEKEKKKIPT